MEQAFVSIGKNHDLQKSFLKALHPEDNQPRALAIFLSVASTHPDKIEKYASLASAYAVVFDQPFPRNWPHHQVPKKGVMVSLSSPSERFATWSRLTPQRKLEYDPSQLSVTELKFVIDHPLTTSELEWARKANLSVARVSTRSSHRSNTIILVSSIGFQLASWEIFPRVDPFQRRHLRRSSLLQFHGWQG